METANLAMVDDATRDAGPVEPIAGFRELYERHSRAVFLTALRVTGNPADAEDVLQTVFVRVLDTRPELEAAGSPRAYLCRAAANAAIDLLRRKKTRGEIDIEAGRWPAETGASAPSAARQDTVLLKERLRAALARLSPENAELFVLCYLEGYSYDELADLFRLERGTVGSRLHRIRATLREDLSR